MLEISVYCLDFESKKLKLDSMFPLDSESELLNLESKFFLDSVFSLHSALGLPSWHSKILDEKSGLSSED